MDKHTALQRYYGYGEFRPGQEALIDAILGGRDALGIMPTGAGKSLCYQLTALLMPGITLVISPLISLMKDQVAALRQMGVAAAYINSSLTAAQSKEALRRAALGQYKIIYVAPERLNVPEFLAFAMDAQLSMLTVDEAHCISQWGQDFRPSYLKIVDFVDLLPKRPVVSAFTATATEKVKHDIQHTLKLRDPFVITTGFDRANLYFEVRKPGHKYTALLDVLSGKVGQSGIVYCATRKEVEKVCAQLIADGFCATRYHAGLAEQERARNQDDFQYDRSLIMVATNAFGMGIDKSNVSFVVHYNMPKNLESYYQEAGRAGRDGESAECVLLYSGQDVITGKWMIDHSEDNPDLSEQDRAHVRQLDHERLKQMTFYSTSKRCLRKCILNYFGERAPETCGNCSVCLGVTREEAAAPDRKQKRPATRAKPKREGRQKSVLSEADQDLYAQLQALRKQLAERRNVPAYVVFSNATLQDMAARRPTTAAAMRAVTGVGDVKLEQFGGAFLAVIQAYMGEYDD